MVGVCGQPITRAQRAAVVANLDTPLLTSSHVTPAVHLLAPLYQHVQPFLIAQPEFATGSYAFIFCSDRVDPGDPSSSVDWARWERKAIATSYYNRAVHAAAFALPEFLERAVCYSQSCVPFGLFLARMELRRLADNGRFRCGSPGRRRFTIPSTISMGQGQGRCPTTAWIGSRRHSSRAGVGWEGSL
jgi:hypothetical protein